MQVKDLIRILEGEITLTEHVNINDPSLHEDKVVVLPRHVKRVFQAYLDGEINDGSLNVWANFLCMRGEYCCNNREESYESDKNIDYYEDMWYVVQKLSTPFMDGKITPELVAQYMSELDRYFDKDGGEIDHTMV